MKNFMVANLSKNKRYNFEDLELLVKAQIENSIELGWDCKDIFLLANFDYEFMGVKSVNADLNKKCLTGSKVFGVKYLFDNNLVDDVIWAHDLDAWQNIQFSLPEIKDVGIACYSNSKFNGGSIFWGLNSKDIVERIVGQINDDEENREEPTLNRILKSKEYNERVTIVNHTYNVGCSGYAVRWQKSTKPLRVCHFHPNNNTAWETHALDRNGLDCHGITDRLESIIRKYYPNLSTELSLKGKEAQIERKLRRLQSLENK